MKYMMIFMAFIFYKVPAGVCLYYIATNAWGLLERKLIPKPTLKPTATDSKGPGGKAKGPATPAEPKSWLPVICRKDLATSAGSDD